MHPLLRYFNLGDTFSFRDHPLLFRKSFPLTLEIMSQVWILSLSLESLTMAVTWRGLKQIFSGLGLVVLACCFPYPFKFYVSLVSCVVLIFSSSFTFLIGCRLPCFTLKLQMRFWNKTLICHPRWRGFTKRCTMCMHGTLIKLKSCYNITQVSNTTQR